MDGEGKSYQGQENATSVLTIDAAEIKNRGNYSCQAASSKGNITSREAVLFIKGDILHSTGVSKLVWISITITAVLLAVLVVLVFVVHKECRKANLKDQKEVLPVSTQRNIWRRPVRRICIVIPGLKDWQVESFVTAISTCAVTVA